MSWLGRRRDKMDCLRWFGIVFWLFSATVHAQSFTKLWGLASYFGKYNDLLYTLEPQIRFIDRAGTYEQTLVNGGVGTTVLPEWQIWLGQTYTNYSDTNNIAEDVENVVLNEYRIWEQIMWRRPFFEKWSSRTRLEQRRAFQSSEWAIRLRERGYYMLPIKENISFSLNDEVFFNLKAVPWVASPFLDQNRLYVGFFYQWSSSMGLNISYLNQYIPRVPVEINSGIVIHFIAYMDEE